MAGFSVAAFAAAAALIVAAARAGAARNPLRVGFCTL
jgi:hypothetical protein